MGWHIFSHSPGSLLYSFIPGSLGKVELSNFTEDIRSSINKTLYILSFSKNSNHGKTFSFVAEFDDWFASQNN